ncbi:heavy metal translocating P-type ATPase [Helicobacter bilis]|uniref:P-type Zn(2+) transporter n=2 Tax=Helicobacter bilis TaxID=37372 RepID=A0A6D2C5K0_9HELI|nr:heavy metal translocating P-type ATPase [Helicobacter bilis]EMZ37286.1 heavy metal translocating P-type ATPase [Helicobacter bilis WiWa]TLE03585.1 heavy metal translocating P-type ATPase [Helicobacter bilis]TLE04290.1 heavy metal translocating P-type ATPase [Helicobacter bilis]
MQKFILENLDCNSCANKLEKSLQSMPCVESANINFSTNTLYIKTSDIEAIKAQIAKIEPDIIVRSTHENTHNVSYKKELSLLLALLFGFAVCMLCLHYTPLESNSFIKSFNMILGVSYAVLLHYTESLSFLHGVFSAITPFQILIYIILLLLYIIAGLPIFRAVWRNMKNKVFFDENTLMFIATIAAFCIGEISESVAVMLFFRIGEFLESLALKRSKKSLYDLLDITPEIAHLQIKQVDSNSMDSSETIWQDTHPELLKVDDIILVKVGEKIPVDGIIMQGESSLNMQAISGESKPIDVASGDEVLAGAINMQSVLTIKVSKPFSHSQVAKIKAMIEDSSNTKAKSEQIITQFAKIYTPIVFFIALGIAFIPPLFDGEWHEWIYRSLVVLMVSCPCALVLSVPLGYFGALGIASKKGILIKGSTHFSNLAKLQQVVFDKTGTLTQGVFQIESINPLTDISKENLLEIAQRAQRFSNHPIAKAIMQDSKNMRDSKNTHICEIESFEEIGGKGVYAKCCGDRILVGNEALMKDKGIDISPFYTHKDTQDSGFSIIHIAKNGIYQGYITLGDILKEESKECMQVLRNLGVNPLAILSGDNEKSVAHIARMLDIQSYYAGLLPTQKAEKLQELMGLDSISHCEASVSVKNNEKLESNACHAKALAGVSNMESQQDKNLDSNNKDFSPTAQNDTKMESTTCHVERSETSKSLESNLESKQDISLNAQYDKVLDSSKSVDKNAAEVSLSDFSKETSFCSFQGGGEGSYLVGNDQADTAESTKSTTCAKHQSKPAKETKHKITAFIGDGINDSIVLKQADIGISIGTKDSHSDISKESADIILTNPSPMGIVHAIKIARKIQTLTWQNITFALGTKLILVLLGIAGIANMWLAVFGDVGVALLALLNALRVVRV